MSIACSRGRVNIKLCDARMTDRLPNSMSFISYKRRRARESESGILLLVTDARIESSSPPLPIAARHLLGQATEYQPVSAGNMVGHAWLVGCRNSAYFIGLDVCLSLRRGQTDAHKRTLELPRL